MHFFNGKKNMTEIILNQTGHMTKLQKMDIKSCVESVTYNDESMTSKLVTEISNFHSEA